MPTSKKSKSVAADSAASSPADQANADQASNSSSAEDLPQTATTSAPPVTPPEGSAGLDPQPPTRIQGDAGPVLDLQAGPAQPVDGESLAALVDKLDEGRLVLPAQLGHVSQAGESVQLDGGHQNDNLQLQAIVPPGHVRVRALRQVEHDGRLYGPDQLAGDEINMPAAQAYALQPTGAIERM